MSLGVLGRSPTTPPSCAATRPAFSQPALHPPPHAYSQLHLLLHHLVLHPILHTCQRLEQHRQLSLPLTPPPLPYRQQRVVRRGAPVVRVEEKVVHDVHARDLREGQEGLGDVVVAIEVEVRHVVADAVSQDARDVLCVRRVVDAEGHDAQNGGARGRDGAQRATQPIELRRRQTALPMNPLSSTHCDGGQKQVAPTR